jgi:hypothetical protein
MSNRGLKHKVSKKNRQSNQSEQSDGNGDVKWQLDQDFDYDALKAFLYLYSNPNPNVSGQYNYGGGDGMIFGFNTNRKIISSISNYVSSFQTKFVRSDGVGMDSFFVDLQKYQYNVQFIDKVAKFHNKGSRVSRDKRKFDLVDGNIEHAVFEVIAISVGDLIKAFYYSNRDQNKGQNKTDFELSDRSDGGKTDGGSDGGKTDGGSDGGKTDGRREEITLLRDNNRNVKELHGKDRKRVQELKKSMISSVMKCDYSDESCNFLGYIRDGKIFQLVQNEYKISNIESFFKSKLIFSNHRLLYSIFNNTQQSYLTKSKSTEKMNGHFTNWFFNNISEQFIDTLVMFFYMGQSLFVSQDEQLVFEDPISMKDWIDLIDPNWSYAGYGTKDKLISDIFKKCNEREEAVLEAQTDMVVDNFDKFDKFLPVYAFRKLHFYRFSNNMLSELVDKIMEAKFMQIVPKRWRGNKKLQAIRNNWVSVRSHDRYHYDDAGKKHEKNNENYHIGKEGVDDFYDMIQISGGSNDDDDLEDSEDDQIAVAYDLPRRLNPEVMDPNDIDLMEGELYKFFTDDEVLVKAVEIEKNCSMSLREKLRELNKIGYSRTAEDKNQVYLLVPPGHQLNQNYSSMMKCENFFVPTIDRKLPRIVLMSLLLGDIDSDTYSDTISDK